jgi:ABC-type antimicrobial peptide transport system permease subunit
LLLGQFSLSVIVLIAGIIFTQNASFQQKVSYGYDKEKVITVTIQGNQEYERLKNAIIANPRIEQVAVAHNHIGYLSSYPNTITINAVEHRSNIYEVGAGYFTVMGLDILNGRDFMENSGLDAQSAAMVDENFVKKYGLTNPIGTRVMYQEQAYSIIGVVKNHLSSLFDKGGQDKDHFYRMARPEQYQVLVARTDASTILQTQQYIEQQWKNNFPGKPFQSSLQEDIVFSGPNEYNKNLKGTFLFLTVLGCLLSASGIYSLASLNVQKRTKEIGVRKVLGASIAGIVALMNREFALILLLAMVLGGGGGYLLTNALLGDLYVQHIDVSLLTVVLCGLFVFAVGISTTSFTILRAARANPTKTLKED